MKKWILVLFFSLFFVLPTKVLAAAEFETSYDVSYEVQPSGVTLVKLKIALENKLSNVYADRFSLSVGLTDVSNIKVNDAVGFITPEVIKTDNQSTIRFQFIDKVVGKGKVNTFSVSYETRDIATKNGAVWELNVPQLETDKGVSDQKITLIVPSLFGLPAFITPTPDTSTKNPPSVDTKNIYTFSAKTLGTKAISAVFGTTQFMRFNLIYHLENNNPVRQKAEVALPPDTNYQRMIYESIQPQPENILVDEDGNWIATYYLNAGEKLNINTVGVVNLDFSPKISPQTNEILQKYLGSEEHWQVSNPQIKTLAQQLRTPEAIYEYVVDFLSYDYNKLTTDNQRVGAVNALLNPLQAICTEFTDLFVTLSRAAGIPARELEGYAFTSNDKLRPLSLTQDVLHAWPEYYDATTQTWKQVDPTWGNTTGGIDYFHKLDLSHFVFVTHGVDSVQPLPAGAYKTETFSNKDVKVIASDPVAIPEENLGFKARLKRNLWGGSLELTITNNGMVSSKPNLSLRSEPVDIISEQRQIDLIPPLASRVITIELNKGLNLTGPKNLIIKYDQREIRIPIETSQDKNLALKVATGGAVTLILVIITYTTSRLFLRRRKQDSPLHW